MLSQEGHLQYRAVLFDALGIEQEGLNQTSWKQPLGLCKTNSSGLQ